MDMAIDLNHNTDKIEEADIRPYNNSNYSNFEALSLPFCSNVYRLNKNSYNIEYTFCCNITTGALNIIIKNNNNYIGTSEGINIENVGVSPDFREVQVLTHRICGNMLIIAAVWDGSTSCSAMNYDENRIYSISYSPYFVPFLIYFNLDTYELESFGTSSSINPSPNDITLDDNNILNPNETGVDQLYDVIGARLKVNAIFIPDKDKYDRAIFDTSIVYDNLTNVNPTSNMVAVWPGSAYWHELEYSMGITAIYDCHYIDNGNNTSCGLLFCYAGYSSPITGSITTGYILIDEDKTIIKFEDGDLYAKNIIIHNETINILSTEVIESEHYCFYKVIKNEDNSYTFNDTSVSYTKFENDDLTLSNFINDTDQKIFKISFNNSYYVASVYEGKTYLWELPDNIEELDPRNYTIINADLSHPAYIDAETGIVDEIWFEKNTAVISFQQKVLPLYKYGHVKVK